MRSTCKASLFSLFFVCCATLALAQPDSNYFQQRVDYKISVKLDDVNHTITGYETVTYTNHSPHTLKYIYFHLWPNAYKNDETALAKQLLESGDVKFHFSPESDRGFIDSLLFKTGNDTLKWEYFKEKINPEDKDEKKNQREYIDIAKVTLARALQPDSTVTITTPFFVKIPSGLFSRLGHIGQSYQITQWFPKPAVYDKNGWNQMPYLNQGEFYSEYGDFDVSITVPKNYLVAATGELTGNPEEERFLELKAKETAEKFKNNNVTVSGNLTGDDQFPASSTEWKTLRYVQKNVHDFAWFADKRWHVLKGEYEFAKSGKLVSIWSFFTRGNSRYWKKSIQYLHDAVHYYSKWVGDYPYSIVTAVDGTISAGGGMEYPTITNIGDVSNDIMLETVIMHEIGHNWFYGILGSNERAHPWMDEGMNSATELRYLQTKYPELTVGDMLGLGSGLNHFLDLDSIKQRMSYYLGYNFSAATNSDQPIELKAAEYTDANYGMIVYYKTAAAFNYLRAYLGDEVYDECMRAYYKEWKFKHPQPADVRRIFERYAMKDLRWFFNDLINTNEVLDYKITKKKKPNTKSTKTYGWMKYEEGVEVINKGGVAAPFLIVGMTHDTIAAKRWQQGFTGANVVTFPNGNFEKIIIDPFFDMPEVNHRNNRYKYKIDGKRMFARTEKFKLKFLMGYPHPDRSMLYYTPVVGYNVYDGAQVGLAVYNSVLLQKPFEFTLMPLYATKTGRLTGSGSIVFNTNFRKSGFLKNATYGVNGMSYSTPDYHYEGSFQVLDMTGRFYRIDPYITFNLKPKTYRSPVAQSIGLHYYYTGSTVQVEQQCLTCTDNAPQTNTLKTSRSIGDIYYRYASSNTLMPHAFEIDLRYSSDFKTPKSDFMYATAEFAISRVLGPRKRKITARLYAGKFFFNNTSNAIYNLRGDGIRGSYDYTYATTFIGRQEPIGSFWGNQFAPGFGNMKTPTAYGQSNDWNAALNLYSDLPVPIIKLFADVATSPVTVTTIGGTPTNPVVSQTTEIKTVADAGVYLSLFGNVLNVYVPLWVSKDIDNEYQANGIKFAERIRFTLTLNPFAPHRLGKTLNFF